jgi:UDP-N-acetylglucosamine 1-carboxyvinyltransferase
MSSSPNDQRGPGAASPGPTGTPGPTGVDRRNSDAVVVVRRSGPLDGEVVVPGAKNSVLKLMAATILADGTYHLSNVPDIVDVTIMSELLAAIGVATTSSGAGRLTMVNEGRIEPVAPYELVERIRASINVLGPLLGRFGRVRLSLPGGDDFGSRPIDMHLSGLEAMGAEVDALVAQLTSYSGTTRNTDNLGTCPSA